MPSSVSSISMPNLISASFATRTDGDHEHELDVELQGKLPSEQLELLNEQLVQTNRIKEGAENLLSIPLRDSQRQHIEAELELAKHKIASIMRLMDTQFTILKEQLDNAETGAISGPEPNSISEDLRNIEDKDKGEDFRSALNTATAFIKELELISQAMTTLKFSTGSTSSTANMQSVICPGSSNRRVELMTNIIGILQRNLRVRYEVKTPDILQIVKSSLDDMCSVRCRATAYRLMRHALVDKESVARVGESLDWYMVKTLIRDNKHAMEKEQAIKLIRTIVEVGSVTPETSIANDAGRVPLSEAVIRAVIAIAEHAEDPFRPICIQTLSEILLTDIDLMARSGGLHFLLHVLGEGPVEITAILASVFLHIMDSPRTRSYLRVGTDLEMAFSAITDAYGKGPDHAERMRGCARVVQRMLRTWAGLIYFCMDDMRAIRSLIDALRIPTLTTRDVILDMFFDLLNIKTPEWYQTFIDGRRLTMYRKNQEAPDSHQDVASTERTHDTFNLTDQYLALLLLVLTKAGLCESITSMLEELSGGSSLARKATLLMAEVLRMSNRVLPLALAAKIQTLPEIFSMAADYQDGRHRIVGTSAISAIDSFNRNRARLEAGQEKGSRVRANSVDDAVRRGQRQVEQAKLKISLQMDDKVFQSSLLETQVMLTKDHTKWNFEILQELVEGPLLNPKRMEEAIKVSRFMRRLMFFFHPFNHRFCDIPRIPSNTRWVRLGCSLMATLMASPDGVKFLSSEDHLLPQIVEGFAQLDPFNGAPDIDAIFSEKRVAETLTYGYLEMLGTLSKYKEGIELLEKFKVFTAFYHLSELRSREDLMKGIIQNLDYNIDGHPRIVLSKALTSSYKHIRLYATRHLGSLIRGTASANAWTLRLLLTQLYDPSPEVCELAVQYLGEACEDKQILQIVVEMQPTMDHLGEIGHPLLLKFMSNPMGFRYLYDTKYIDREMALWFNERNIYYVIQVETFLSKVFNATHHEKDVMTFEGIVPPHFYGEMSKTELGCQILQEKGHFAEFALFIKHHSLESDDGDLIIKLKSILWAVGNVGATEGGLQFLEEEEIIPSVLEIAEKSPVPSVRGTCFFVLGLISSTSLGAEILDDYQWESTLSPLGLPTGLCIPVDLEKFINIPTWSHHPSEMQEPPLVPPTSEHEIEIITAIQSLANTVIANAASRTLTRMKSRPEYREAFSSPEMMYRALYIISKHRFRLPVRRYIVDLFNIELSTDVIAHFEECAQNLKGSITDKRSETNLTRLSILGRFGRSARPSESDESDVDGLEPHAHQARALHDKPVITLQPMHTVIGFHITSNL